LFRWVAEIMERRLDRDRPLWECWIVDGLENNRWAILMKIHHCIADGIAATRMLAALCDQADGGTFATKIRAAEDEPTRGPLRWSALTVSAASAIPYPLTAWTVRALTRLPQRGVVTVATNVPGPRRRQRIMGREVIRLLPIPPIALHIRIVIAILSYADHLTFGITADYDAAPDVDELASGIERSVAHLTAVSKAPSRATSKGTLALLHGGGDGVATARA
jgi:hypothetical protein